MKYVRSAEECDFYLVCGVEAGEEGLGVGFLDEGEVVWD